GLLTESGLEVLVHIGLDTVALDGQPFEVKISSGQKVVAGDLAVVADLEAIKAAGKETSVIIVFTNVSDIKTVKLEKSGPQIAKTVVAKVEL
ncbi:TPA: PTS glucose transporter subunit IIA, partial [Streptococcus agalactiae]